MSARVERVRRVLAAGARVADPADPLGREARERLPAASGLSREGVALALEEHLEREASAGELDAFVGRAGEAPRAFVVASANVCTAALRAIAFACAAAPEVAVRPSRRDPVVAELVARALGEDTAFAAAGGRIALVADASGARAGDELHVYGSDETVAACARDAGAGVVVRGHGAGLGAALVGAGADVAAAADALARDVVPFDQRGCLSPRFALVAGGAARAEAFARALADALARAGERVPRGDLDDPARAESARYAAILRAVGALHAGRDHAVGFDPAPRALVLPPAARAVHVVPAEPDAALALLAPFRRHLTSVGVAQPADGATLDGFSLRVAPLGRMQKPPFDGPVDLRLHAAPNG